MSGGLSGTLTGGAGMPILPAAFPKSANKTVWKKVGVNGVGAISTHQIKNRAETGIGLGVRAGVHREVSLNCLEAMVEQWMRTM